MVKLGKIYGPENRKFSSRIELGCIVVYTFNFDCHRSWVGLLRMFLLYIGLNIQEGWLSPTERASVSAISLRHVLASPGYATGTITVSITWMKRGFNACQTHRSMYPSIFNRFPVIQPVSSKVRNFSTFLHILASPGYVPGTIAVCYIDGKRIQCWSNA